MKYKTTYKKCYAIANIMKSVRCYKCDKSSPHPSLYINLYVHKSARDFFPNVSVYYSVFRNGCSDRKVP